MKHLLYLDRDYLYSYYAQAFDGLENNRQKEHLDQTQTSQTQEAAHVESNVGFSLNFPAIAGLQAGRKDVDDHIQSTFIETEAVREAITVSMHDNALEKVMEHSRPIQDGSFSRGDYVIEKGPFFLTDVQYFLDRLTPELINYIAEQTWNGHLEKLPNPNSDAVQKGKKAFIDNEKKSLENSRKNIESMAKIAQFEVFLLIKNFIIPLKREYLREDPRILIFKYDSDVAIFGQVTRINNPENKPDSKNSFAVLNGIFNNVWPSMLIRMGLLKDDNYKVISPMAVYFE